MNGLSIAAFSALAFASGVAGAEQFGDSGTFAIGVDRIFGYVSDTQSYDYTLTVPTGTGTTSTKTTSEMTVSNFSVFGRTSWSNGTRIGQLPRLSFDAFLGPGVSVGGSLMYDHYSISNKSNGVEDPDKPSLGLWLFSPRVGFAYMFTPQVGIWPRVGITYVHTSIDSTNTSTTGTVTTTSESLGLVYYTMDVNLVVTPVSHVGFTIGPTLDYLLSYSQSSTPAQTNPQSNQKEHALGFQAGFLGWF